MSEPATESAWDPCSPTTVRLLETAEHERVVPIYYGSNLSFLVTLDAGAYGTASAVYKPARGEYPLYDFPAGSLYKREVATYLVDRLLDWTLVPPTVVTRGKHGVGSLQLFVPSFSQGESDVRELRHLALLDVVANNADRKADHCLIAGNGKLWGIDHGLTFHSQPKLRTVLWHFAGQPLSEGEQQDLESLLQDLESKSPRIADLADMLSAPELRAVRGRVSRLLDAGAFPDPRYKAVPYRW